VHTEERILFYSSLVRGMKREEEMFFPSLPPVHIPCCGEEEEGWGEWKEE